jgi:hypothetical protein
VADRQYYAFRREIEDLKRTVGQPGNYNNEWEELLEKGREIMQWIKLLIFMECVVYLSMAINLILKKLRQFYN